MDQKKLDAIIDKHRKWLMGENGGERANLMDANLTDANLADAVLMDANLTDANLTRANLTRTYLTRANLTRANLTRANLTDANLTDAYLTRANLTRANLTDANLADAVLMDANLTRANLTRANLTRTYLTRANLTRANLTDANLTDAVLVDAIMYNLQCPEEGAFIGWKKCKNNIIVKLKITDDALRSSATSRKCRASKVEVLEIFGAKKAESGHRSGFFYEVGETIEINDFDTNRWNECSTGIHFFITKKEAEEY
jgi:uncharacterized protein YjbI with pentapeptide repeats